MITQTVSFRLPEELIKRLKAKARSLGRSKTSLIIEALNQSLTPPTQPTSARTIKDLQQPTSARTIKDLQQQIESLQSQLVELSQAVYSEDGFRDRILDLEQRTADNESALGRRRIGAKQGEETQRQTTQMAQQGRMLNQILSVSPDLLVSYDRIGRFTYVNAAAARTFGFHPRDLLGKTWREINFPSALAIRLSAQNQSVLTTGQTICNEISFPTGTEVRTYECILCPIWHEEGWIDSILCTGRDITERKQAEKELQASEERYRTLFDSSNDAIFIIDSATRQCLTVNHNAARRLGYTRQEIEQLSLDDIVATTSDNTIDDSLQELQAKGNGIFEQVHQRKDGTEMPVEVSGHVVEYGDRLAFQWAVRDIRDRKQARKSRTVIFSGKSLADL